MWNSSSYESTSPENGGRLSLERADHATPDSCCCCYHVRTVVTNKKVAEVEFEDVVIGCSWSFHRWCGWEQQIFKTLAD